MESFLPLMKDQIKDDYRRLRASASASSSSTSSAPNSPGVLSRSDRASRRVSITQSPPSNRSIPVRTPIKARPAAAPSPSDSDATPPASQRPQRTPTKAPPPRHLLKHTPSRPSPLKNAMSSRKRKSPSPTPVDLPDLYAVPEERVVVQKKVRRSFIDDVGDDEGAVEARYVKYLKVSPSPVVSLRAPTSLEFGRLTFEPFMCRSGENANWPFSRQNGLDLPRRSKSEAVNPRRLHYHHLHFSVLFPTTLAHKHTLTHTIPCPHSIRHARASEMTFYDPSSNSPSKRSKRNGPQTREVFVDCAPGVHQVLKEREK